MSTDPRTAPTNDQRSTTDQLRDAVTLLNRAGMYDASDHCRRAVEDTERRMQPSVREQVDRAQVVAALIAVREQAEGYDSSIVASGAVIGVQRVADRLGIDLDAELAKETK